MITMSPKHSIHFKLGVQRLFTTVVMLAAFPALNTAELYLLPGSAHI